jgi:hypothetical protein
VILTYHIAAAVKGVGGVALSAIGVRAGANENDGITAPCRLRNLLKQYAVEACGGAVGVLACFCKTGNICHFGQDDHIHTLVAGVYKRKLVLKTFIRQRIVGGICGLDYTNLHFCFSLYELYEHKYASRVGKIVERYTLKTDTIKQCALKRQTVAAYVDSLKLGNVYVFVKQKIAAKEAHTLDGTVKFKRERGKAAKYREGLVGRQTAAEDRCLWSGAVHNAVYRPWQSGYRVSAAYGIDRGGNIGLVDVIIATEYIGQGRASGYGLRRGLYDRLAAQIVSVVGVGLFFICPAIL